jgi:hypothetical protein
MIHDLELTTVVDAQGVLTEKFTDSDYAKIDEGINYYNNVLCDELDRQFLTADLLSEKLAIIDLMRQLNHPELPDFIKILQDEL